MNREIKFRGKEVEIGVWVEGCLIQRMGYYPGIMSSYSYGGKIRYSESCVTPETVGQFTGLKDKDGVEIYEGDLLRSDTYPFSCMEDGVKDNYFGEVYWCEETFSWSLVSWKNPKSSVRGISHGIGRELYEINPAEFEVVGNIYDNPELFEQWGGKEAMK